MPDTNNSHIDVAELMKRVRARAAEFRPVSLRPNLPPVPELRSLPTAILPQPVRAKTEQIVRAAQGAREATSVSRWIPRPLRGLFRRQGKVDNQIIRAVEYLAQTNEQLADRLRHLAACVEVQDHGIHHLAELRRSDGEWMNAAAQLTNTLQSQVAFRRHVASLEQKIIALEERFTEIAGEVNELVGEAGGFAELRSHTTILAEQLHEIRQDKQQLSQHTSQMRAEQEQFGAKLGHLETRADRHADDLANLQSQTNSLSDNVAILQRQHDQLSGADRTAVGQHLNNLQNQADDQGAHLHNLQAEADALRSQVGRYSEQLDISKQGLEQTRLAFVRADERQVFDAAFLKSELTLLDRRVMQLSTVSRKAARPALPATPEPDHQLDALYVAFEDQFRGSRELIKNRLRVYIKDLTPLNVVTPDTPVLDLGCGRGEWLELLQDHSLASEGVDLNTVFAALCNQRGLRVTEADAIAYLRSLPAGSRGAITAFHLIEHLHFPVLVDLTKEVLRVLRPGGLVIFETPNPDNILVGSNRFYSDPTHLHPLPKEYSAFLLRSVGFTDVTTRPLNPDSDSLREDSASPELRNLLNRLLFGDQDYAVIGRKPTA